MQSTRLKTCPLVICICLARCLYALLIHEQETSYKQCTFLGILVGNQFLLSRIILCLANFVHRSFQLTKYKCLTSFGVSLHRLTETGFTETLTKLHNSNKSTTNAVQRESSQSTSAWEPTQWPSFNHEQVKTLPGISALKNPKMLQLSSRPKTALVVCKIVSVHKLWSLVCSGHL